MEIYEFQNYRDAMEFLVKQHLEQGGSYRSFSKVLGFASPNYLQQILTKKRNLTPVMAKRIAEKVYQKKDFREYFLCLVKLESTTVKDKDSVLEAMRSIRYKCDNKVVRDETIHSSWLNQIVFEACKLKDMDLTVDCLKNALNIHVSSEELQEAISLCLRKKWIVETGIPGRYKQNDIRFPFLDDVRRIDIQRSHLKFLELAKHRINADVGDREFRGLTITCPRDKIETVRTRIRKFFDELDLEIESYGDKNCMIRLQMCMYMLTK